MKAYEFALVVLGAGWSSATAQEPAVPVDVMVYVTGGTLVPGAENLAAQDTASRIFARIGIRIGWLKGKPQTIKGTANTMMIHVRFVRRPMDDCTSAALAYATPFAKGTKTITILRDRIRLVASSLCPEHCMLAHVLAHEIAHVVQGTNRHDDTGVMKAVWNREDNAAMGQGLLDFTATDVALIRRGLNRPSAWQQMHTNE